MQQDDEVFCPVSRQPSEDRKTRRQGVRIDYVVILMTVFDGVESNQEFRG
jgi:hypothetical protein